MIIFICRWSQIYHEVLPDIRTPQECLEWHLGMTRCGMIIGAALPLPSNGPSILNELNGKKIHLGSYVTIKDPEEGSNMGEPLIESTIIERGADRMKFGPSSMQHESEEFYKGFAHQLKPCEICMRTDHRKIRPTEAAVLEIGGEYLNNI